MGSILKVRHSTSGEWIDIPAIVGPKGEDGAPGKDALQEAVLYTPQELTEEQKAQARENIGLDELPTGGASIFHFTTTVSSEPVKQVSLNLPVNWGRIKIINIHVRFGEVDTAFKLYGTFGGYTRELRGIIETGTNVGLNLYCVKHTGDLFSTGIGYSKLHHDSAHASTGSYNVMTNADRNDLSLYSNTADVLMPGGITFEIWGVYE